MNNIIAGKTYRVFAEIKNAATDKKEIRWDREALLADNNIEIYGLQAYTRDQLSKDTKGRSVITAAAAAGAVVTIVNQNTQEVLYEVPYNDLVKQINGGLVFTIKPLPINLTDCKVIITDATGMAAGEVFVFNLFYRFITPPKGWEQ